MPAPASVAMLRGPETDPRPTAIELDRMSITFDTGKGKTYAVDRAEARIAEGEFICVLGPSGCGKSTVLNAIAGFLKPSAGHVRVLGQDVTGPGPDRGMVFQQPLLFPWKTVRSNIAHGPRMQGRSRAEQREIADRMLNMIGLGRFAEAYPHQLSGGMQQRVAIARALALEPRVLLMDEPFGALDAQTRIMMQENLLRIWDEVRATVVFVTHDIDEAVFLADRILVMGGGGRILRDIPVPMPRPRDSGVAMEPEFLSIKKDCFDLIRDETRKVFGEDH